MKSITLLLLSMLFTVACSVRKPVKLQGLTRATSIDSLKVTVTCLNLSENLSKNDEVLIFAYLHKDSATLDAPLFRQPIKIDLKGMSYAFQWRLIPNLNRKKIDLFLIEQDSEREIDLIDSALRMHYNAIIDAFKTNNYSAMEKYLGDDDVLGIQTISEMDYIRPYAFYFNGIYKLDRYEYRITIEENNK